MPPFKDAWTEHQLKRWMRPDAYRYIRPDWRRFWNAGHENDPLYRFYESVERKFSPDQPRVPVGSSEGGQWTSEGTSGSSQPVSRPQRTRLADAASTINANILSDGPPPGSNANGASSPEFGPGKSGWHDYSAGPNLVCAAELRCSREEIADQLARFSIPGRDPSSPVVHGDGSFVFDPRTGLPGGLVTTRIEDSGLKIINQTSPAHLFYDGVVVRQATLSDDGAWFVTTRGFGNNVIPGMNMFNREQGPVIFGILDQRMRANIERHHAKGILDLGMRRVDGCGDCRRRALLAGAYHVR
jgi:hypothetical protein